ncbi:MAG: DUF2061 domain-containing protein [Paracoccaceae bacterium]|nr:DUF2061 domain-containing protein [Paracoccaceae bacterium]
METRRRSILKGLIWNALGLAVMAAVGVAFTGSAAIGGAMALANAAIGFASYFLYERVWAGIGWGRHG